MPSPFSDKIHTSETKTYTRAARIWVWKRRKEKAFSLTWALRRISVDTTTNTARRSHCNVCKPLKGNSKKRFKATEDVSNTIPYSIFLHLTFTWVETCPRTGDTFTVATHINIFNVMINLHNKCWNIKHFACHTEI